MKILHSVSNSLISSAAFSYILQPPLCDHQIWLEWVHILLLRAFLSSPQNRILFDTDFCLQFWCLVCFKLSTNLMYRYGKHFNWSSVTCFPKWEREPADNLFIFVVDPTQAIHQLFRTKRMFSWNCMLNDWNSIGF